MGSRIGMLGFGHAVPSRVRRNDDPIYNKIRSGSGTEVELFSGARERRHLGPGESIEALMVEAGRLALKDAGLPPEKIERLYGYSFVSSYLTPNGLYEVHRDLGLDERAMVVPVNCEFSNFITGVALAWEAIKAGRITYAMVNCGASMSRHMNYGSGHAGPVGDGAGAVIVGPCERYSVIDYDTRVLSRSFDVMTMGVRFIERHGERFLPLNERGLPAPVYEIGEAGLKTYMTSGVDVPPRLTLEMLSRHGIDASQVALISHQASQCMLDGWARSIRPMEQRDTYAEYGNVTLASIPITLSVHREAIRAEYIVLLSPGTGTHFAALLLKR